jgi:DNA-binding SARP family transcriptional activator
MSASFRLLGDIEVRVCEQPVEIGPARMQCVLAGLLVNVNQCVSTDLLVERTWGDHRLPYRPRNALQTYVSLLRRALAGKMTIEWKRAGYLARAAEDSIDLHRFRQLVRLAANAGDDEAARLLEQALLLWRGEAFGLLDTPWLAAVRTGLDQQRRAARLDLAEIRLRRGEHARLLTVLSEWAGEYPLDERLIGLYMLALHRSGRTADALYAFRRVRERLVAEIGTDPSPQLSRLHQQILAFDPVIAAPAGS